MRYFSSRNAVGTRVAHSTSSLDALTYFTIVVICPLSSSFFCIIALIGSSSLRSTDFQRAYSPLMQNGAFSASALGTTRTSLHFPRSMSSHMPTSSARPMAGSALVRSATGPNVHVAAACLYAAEPCTCFLNSAAHSGEGNVNAMTADFSTLRVHEVPGLWPCIINTGLRLERGAAAGVLGGDSGGNDRDRGTRRQLGLHRSGRRHHHQ